MDNNTRSKLMQEEKPTKAPTVTNFAMEMIVSSMKDKGIVQIYCDNCNYMLKEGEEWYHSQEKSDYDLCLKCGEELKETNEMFLNNYDQLRAPSQLGTHLSVSSMLRRAFKVYSNRLCMGHRRLVEGKLGEFQLEDSYTWFNYKYIYDQAVRLGSGFMRKFGLAKGDFIGICGSNSVRWVICDIACIIRGLVVVPIDNRLTLEETSSIMNNARVKVVFVDGNPLQSKFEELLHSKSCKDFYGIVQIDTVSFLKGIEKNPLERNSHTKYEELIELRNESLNLNSLSDFDKKDIVTLVYTSGSTGKPKGAIFTNEVWMKGFDYYGTTRFDPYVQFSKHPLSYISDRENVLETFKFGGRVGMCSDISNVFKDVILLNPCKFGGTPRFFNVIYTEFRASLELDERIKIRELGRKLRPAERQKIRNENLERFSKTLGNRVQGISVGGAAVSTVVWKFMKELWGSKVTEGYGTTEAGSICYGTSVDPTTDYKLVDVPEMGYFTSDKPHPRGELMVKTSTMITGYYNNEEETNNSFEDGYFRTGDIVAEISHRNLSIIDRKKNIFKLSQGEFISPEKLENQFVGNEFVHQIFISCANLTRFAEQSSPMAVVVPEEIPLTKWWTESNLPPTSFETICSSVEAKKKIWEELRITAIQSKLKNFEIPSFVHLETCQFTIENRKMTVSNKLARPILQKAYEWIFEDHLSNGIQNQFVSKDSFNEGSNQQALELLKKAMGGNKLEEGEGNPFLKSGGDSLSAVRLRNLIKRETDVEVPVEMIYDPNFSVAKLNQILHDKSIPKNITSSPTFSFEEYTELGNDIQINWEDSTDDAPAIFLTGSTGFLGQFILHELLERSNGSVSIHCLVRCKNSEDGKQRLKDQMIKFGIWDNHKEKFDSVVRVVQGDLSKEKFGLNPEAWRELAISIQSIIHCGAYVNHTQPYFMHRDANVMGTKWIIQLASEGRKKILNYVSSIGVVSSLSRSLYRPSFVKSLPGYSQSKWVAENLVQQGREKGIPTNIFRPGMISWHTKLGGANLLDWFCRLIVGSLALGLFPNAPTWTTKGVNLVPVDYVSSAIAATTLSNAYNETMDLMSGSLTLWNQFGKEWMPLLFEQGEDEDDVNWNRVRESISNFGLQISSESWVNYVHSEIDDAQKEGKEKRHQALTGLLLFPNGQLPTDSNHQETLDSDRNILKSMGISCPPIEYEHVETFLRFITRSSNMEQVIG